MASLRLVLMNFLQMRHSPRCTVKIGRGTTTVPYIVSAEKTDTCIIGKYCSIGHGVVIITHPGHNQLSREYRVANYPLARVSAQGFKSSYYLPEKKNFVRIGNDVWIGINAIILPGVTVHDGAIIGAGSVVTHDVPPYAIVAGVPARVLRYRYSPDQISKLMKIAWWNWSEKKIAENMDYFYGKIELFIQKFSNSS